MTWIFNWVGVIEQLRGAPTRTSLMNLRCFELHRNHHLGQFRELWHLFLFVCPLFYFFVAQSLRGTTSSNRSKQSISNKQSTSRTSITPSRQSMTSKQSTSSKQSISSKDAGKLYGWLYDGLTCDMLTRAFIAWWWSKIIAFSFKFTTVRTFEYSSTREQSNKRSWASWKREWDWGGTLKIRSACEARALGACVNLTQNWTVFEKKKMTVLQSTFSCVFLFSWPGTSPSNVKTWHLNEIFYLLFKGVSVFCKLAGACEIFHFINQNFRYEFASHTQECSLQLYSD